VKVGDIVQILGTNVGGQPSGIVMSEIRHGINASFVDVFVNGQILAVNFKVLKVINESR